MAIRPSALENMVTTSFWHKKRVFLTGHTGFKGSWLALWLKNLGAEITGYALAPPTNPSLFEIANISSLVNSHIADIRDVDTLNATIKNADPEIIFHLAAQPLVGEGYRDPVGTYATNVTGTINLLEAARRLDNLRAIVVITTDKCYENCETLNAYREDAPLGGHDPYSSSKACTEILTHAWRRSFFSAPDAARLATARAGNVIGGGDWAANRLVPDLMQAFNLGQAAALRNPEAIRPWQHVLEPLAGYLKLAETLCAGNAIESAWNFGPALNDCVAVGEVANRLAALWPSSATWFSEASDFPHEANFLLLDASLAQSKLDWSPRWPLQQALQHTVDWQLAWLRGEDMQKFSRQQILSYSTNLENV